MLLKPPEGRYSGAGMDLYSFVKLLHILSAVVWVGGGFMLMVSSELALRASGPTFQGFSEISAKLGMLLFMPSALLTLLFGIVLTVMGWSFADLWVILALVGIAVSIAIGIVIIKPTTDKIAELAASQGPESPQVRSMTASLIRKGRFDLVLMVVIIADMVFKPGYDDVLLLAVMAAVLAIAAVAFLVMQPAGAAAKAA